jgi:hypothetical protein
MDYDGLTYSATPDLQGSCNPCVHPSVHQVPVLVKPQCMLLRNLGCPWGSSADAPKPPEFQCALKGGKSLLPSQPCRDPLVTAVVPHKTAAGRAEAPASAAKVRNLPTRWKHRACSAVLVPCLLQARALCRVLLCLSLLEVSHPRQHMPCVLPAGPVWRCCCSSW